MIEREVDLSFWSESWEDENNILQKNAIEKMLYSKGIQYISTPRSGRRGGGASIAVSLKNFSITKCNIAIPSGLECVWGILRPKTPSNLFSQIICCCFYSPPVEKENEPLIDHISSTLQCLMKHDSNESASIN